MSNNNELRAQLLIEAADLLNESTGRNGKLSKLDEQLAKDRLIKAKKNDRDADKYENASRDLMKDNYPEGAAYAARLANKSKINASANRNAAKWLRDIAKESVALDREYIDKVNDKNSKNQTRLNSYKFTSNSKIQPKSRFDRKGQMLHNADTARRNKIWERKYGSHDVGLHDVINSRAKNESYDYIDDHEFITYINESINELYMLNSYMNGGYVLSEAADGDSLWNRFLDKVIDIVGQLLDWIRNKLRKQGVCEIIKPVTCSEYVLKPCPTEYRQVSNMLYANNSKEDGAEIANDLLSKIKNNTVNYEIGQTIQAGKIYRNLDSLRNDMRRLRKVNRRLESSYDKQISGLFRQSIMLLIKDTKTVINAMESTEKYGGVPNNNSPV